MGTFLIKAGIWAPASHNPCRCQKGPATGPTLAKSWLAAQGKEGSRQELIFRTGRAKTNAWDHSPGGATSPHHEGYKRFIAVD